jgi:hypothetical protein
MKKLKQELEKQLPEEMQQFRRFWFNLKGCKNGTTKK